MDLATAAAKDAIVLSNSLMQSVTSCERKFYYDYVLGLSSDPTRAMDLGSWFHAVTAVHHLEKGIEEGTLLGGPPETLHLGFDGLEEVEVWAEDRILKPTTSANRYPLDPEGVLMLLTDHQWALLPRSIREEHNGDETYHENLELEFPGQVWDLYERWVYHWRHKQDKVLLVEHEWQRTDEGTGLTYGGRADVVVQREDGFVVVRDEKSTGSQPSMAYRLTNLQTLLYAWGISPSLEEHGLGPARMVELDYLITKTPGLLRLKNPTKKQLEADPDYTGDPYANVGHMDQRAFLLQCEMLGEDPRHEKFSKIHKRLKSYTNDDHPFFQRWEMVANRTTIAQVLDEHEQNWDTAKALLTRERAPVRNLHPVLCGMCHRSDECALEFQGGSPDFPTPTRTLPLVGGGETTTTPEE